MLIAAISCPWGLPDNRHFVGNGVPKSQVVMMELGERSLQNRIALHQQLCTCARLTTSSPHGAGMVI